MESVIVQGLMWLGIVVGAIGIIALVWMLISDVFHDRRPPDGFA